MKIKVPAVNITKYAKVEGKSTLKNLSTSLRDPGHQREQFLLRVEIELCTPLDSAQKCLQGCILDCYLGILGNKIRSYNKIRYLQLYVRSKPASTNINQCRRRSVFM